MYTVLILSHCTLNWGDGSSLVQEHVSSIPPSGQIGLSIEYVKSSAVALCRPLIIKAMVWNVKALGHLHVVESKLNEDAN